MADHPVRGNWLVVTEMWSLAKAGSATAGGFPPPSPITREDIACDVDGVLWPDPPQTCDAEAEVQ